MDPEKDFQSIALSVCAGNSEAYNYSLFGSIISPVGMPLISKFKDYKQILS